MRSPRFPRLAAPIELGGVSLRNRLAHASILTHFVRDGRATDELLNYHAARARGGAGLIVTEPLAMTEHNRDPRRLRAWDDGAFESLERLADAVESLDTRILGQLQDPGRGRHSIGRNEAAVGATALPDDLSWTVPRPLSRGEIGRMIEQWADGARRLQRAGFSGVEISAGHGHLVHQFLSPASNRRDDEYGGSGRLRFLRELIDAIRAACLQPFILGLKLPADDGVLGGIDLDEAAKIAGQLAATGGFDYWTWVWGAHANSLWWHLPDAHGDRHPYLASIRALRQVQPDIVTGALGYMTDPAECEAALGDGTADLVFLGRPLIADPAFGDKAQRNERIRHCVSGNSCWRSVVESGRLACDNNPRVGRSDDTVVRAERSAARKSVVVVGGGPAGLEAACQAALRGHAVHLYSASPEPGGKTRLHARLPGGQNLSSVYDYLAAAAVDAGATLYLGERAEPGMLRRAAPDVVLLASGATIAVPHWLTEDARELIPDIREMAARMLDRQSKAAGRVLVVDCDHTEMTYATVELLCERFEHVTIATPRDRIASDTSLINRQGIYHRLLGRGVEILPNVDIVSIAEIDAARVSLRNVWSGRDSAVEDVVAICYAGPRIPDDALVAPLEAAGLDVRTIGDCRAPRGLMAATADGFRAALSLS